MERDDRWDAHDDESLMSALGRQDESALRELIRRYSALVYSVCWRILGRALDAEEVAAEVFSEIWQHSQRYDPQRSSARTYLLLLGRSRSLDRIRSTKRDRDRREEVTPLHELPNSSADSPSAPADRNELAIMIQGGLAKLSEEQRTAIELSFFKGMTHPEIAEQMGAPLGSVKSHIRRGLLKLQQLMAPQGTREH